MPLKKGAPSWTRLADSISKDVNRVPGHDRGHFADGLREACAPAACHPAPRAADHADPDQSHGHAPVPRAPTAGRTDPARGSRDHRRMADQSAASSARASSRRCHETAAPKAGQSLAPCDPGPAAKGDRTRAPCRSDHDVAVDQSRVPDRHHHVARRGRVSQSRDRLAHETRPGRVPEAVPSRILGNVDQRTVPAVRTRDHAARRNRAVRPPPADRDDRAPFPVRDRDSARACHAHLVYHAFQSAPTDRLCDPSCDPAPPRCREFRRPGQTRPRG